MYEKLKNSEEELYGLYQVFSMGDCPYWLPRPSWKDKLPYIGDIRFFPPCLAGVSSFPVWTLYLLVCLIWTSYAALFLVLLAVRRSPWVIVHVPYHALLLLLGYMLFQCQLLQHSKIKRILFKKILCPNEYKIQAALIVEGVDLEESNAVFMAELALETVPQILVQFLNNFLIYQVYKRGFECLYSFLTSDHCSVCLSVYYVGLCRCEAS